MTANFSILRRSLLVLFLAAAVSCLNAQADRVSEARGRAREIATANGYIERGADIHPSQLDSFLPPPPRDAIPYEVREPLRNGRTVPVKKRWLWVPEEHQITYKPVTLDDKSVAHMEVPTGSMWWKEFYIETSAGAQLIERRILRKTDDAGGWRLYTAHFLPEAADGITGNLLDIASFLWTPGSARFFYSPEEWMPTVKKSAQTKVTFYDNTGAEFPYIFPGGTACTRCHNGAAAAYDEADDARTLAFGLHPRNLTAQSVKNFISQGQFDAPSFESALADETARAAETQRLVALLRPSSGVPADSEEAAEARTRRLLDVFRNNCVSCHNHSAQADARVAALKLDPNRDYTTKELVQLLVTTSVRGPNSRGLPLLTPGRPDLSELYLRLLGTGGRLRMPPAEGGLPEQDPYFLALVEDWIMGLPVDVVAAAPPSATP